MTRVMASLFDLQRATINKNGYDPCLAEIKQLRRSIRRDWENITAFLKQTNQFADDINYLRTIVATATMEELDQFKNDLIEASKELVIKCQALTSVKRDGVSPYDTFWSKGRRARSSSPYRMYLNQPAIALTETFTKTGIVMVPVRWLSGRGPNEILTRMDIARVRHFEMELEAWTRLCAPCRNFGGTVIGICQGLEARSY